MQTCGRHPHESTTINYSNSSEWTRRAQWTQGMAGCRLFHCTRKSTFHHSPRPQMYLGFVLGSLSTLLPSSSPSSSSHMACPFDVRASSQRVPPKTLRARQLVPNRTKPVSCRLKHILVRHCLDLFLPVRGCCLSRETYCRSTLSMLLPRVVLLVLFPFSSRKWNAVSNVY